MRPKMFRYAFLALALAIITLSVSAFGQTESTLYFFSGGVDGGQPYGSLIFDASGNLYGTTNVGGTKGQGAVFELTPLAGGGWIETTLYSFGSGNNIDGQNPSGGLIFDSAGNLYGVTANGGVYNLGIVFELSPVAGGGWSEQVLYNFAGGLDVGNPGGCLVSDGDGNLYGATSVEGANSQGGVFELSPSGGDWTEKVILAGNTEHGGNFLGPVVFDNRGGLYAAAGLGGAKNAGSIYRMTLVGGVWKPIVIYTFQGGNSDGNEPTGGLTFRIPNHLYGVTAAGGSYGYGTAFELTEGAGESWKESVLYSFGSHPSDGQNPEASLTFGPAGQLYGTTFSGGSSRSGTAFELAKSGGVWKEKNLHSFSNGDTGIPAGSVVLDSSGNLYGLGHAGTTVNGGVYQIVP